MKSLTSTSPASPRLFIPCAVIFVFALAIRLAYALALPVRVSADAGYYVMVAENLYRGGGFAADYLWNYLAGLPQALPAPGNEYWMPGTSVVTAGAFAIARSPSLRVAQVPSLLFGALLCALTAWLGGLLFRRRDVALLAGALAALSFHLVGVSLYPDHFGQAACLVNLALLALWASWHRSPAYALAAGALAALTYLTRADGAMLVFVAIVLAIGPLRAGPRRRTLLLLAGFLAAFALVAAPWWMRQTIVFGSPSGAGPLQTAFLTQYNDLFRLDTSHLNLRDYLQTNQRVALLFKGFVLYRELRLLAAVLGLIGLLAIPALRDSALRRRAAPWLIYLIVALLAPALLFPYPTIKGGFWHLLPGLCPILFALGAGQAILILDRGRKGRAIAARAAWLAPVLCLAYVLAWWKAAPAEIARGEPPAYPTVAREAVSRLDPRGVVLTDNSWGLYHVARVPCAQFPSDGASAALQVADHLGAAYLVTLANAPDRIPAISEVVSHPRFQPWLRYPTDGAALLVYRILPPEPRPRSPQNPAS